MRPAQRFMDAAKRLRIAQARLTAERRAYNAALIAWIWPAERRKGGKS